MEMDRSVGRGRGRGVLAVGGRVESRGVGNGGGGAVRV